MLVVLHGFNQLKNLHWGPNLQLFRLSWRGAIVPPCSLDFGDIYQCMYLFTALCVMESTKALQTFYYNTLLYFTLPSWTSRAPLTKAQGLVNEQAYRKLTL